MKKILIFGAILLFSIGFLFAAGSKEEDKKEELLVEGVYEGKIEFIQGKPETAGAYDAIIALFNKEYPNVEVEQINIPDASTVIITRLASGDPPDLLNHFILNADFRPLADSGQLLDLTDESFMNRVKPAILEMAKYPKDGKIYGLPLTMNSMGIWYNMDKLEELGLEPAKTYNELLILYDTIEAAGEIPMMTPNKDAWTLNQLFSRRLGQEFALTGNDFSQTFEKIASGELMSKDVPEVVKAVEKVLKLNEYGSPDAFGLSFAQGCEEFALGKSVMFFQGTWVYPNVVKANPNANVALYPFPAEEEGEGKVSVNIDISLCIPKDSENIELSKLFLEFLTRPENMQVFTNIDGSIPLLNDVSVKIEALDPLYAQVNSGETYILLRSKFPTGFIQWQSIGVGELIISKDTEVFYEELDKAVIEMWIDENF